VATSVAALTATAVRSQDYPDGMHTRGSLARLAYGDGARELSEQLVSTAATTSDSWGQGAFLTEEASAIFIAARELLAAAVVADRERGCSWSDVGEGLQVTRQSAQERFVAAERDFREVVLFPGRTSADGGSGRCVAPDAVENPEQVGRRLDQWVRAARSARGSDQDDHAPVTAGLARDEAHGSVSRMSDVLALKRMLNGGELPAGVSRAIAERRHAELNVDLWERVCAERPDDEQACAELATARGLLETIVNAETSS
jgi:hypothetical protein